MVNELTAKYEQKRDLRAKAMIQVMMNKYSGLDYSKYLTHESETRKTYREAKEQTKKEQQGDFSTILARFHPTKIRGERRRTIFH